MKYVLLYILLTMPFFSCKSIFGSKKSDKPASTQSADPARINRYTGSLYKDNYVWGGAMNLCWTELCHSVIHAPIALNTSDPKALETAERLNHPVCSVADLDEPSYYIKAGYGPKTLKMINEECRAKFPNKTFGDLDMPMGEQDIISYAYFFKQVRYKAPFTRQKVLFMDKQVGGFEAKDNQKQNVLVLQYESNDRFILQIRLQDSGDELILAKGYDTRQPAEVLQALSGVDAQAGVRIGDDDFFKMPLLKLKFKRDYAEMIGKGLKNEGFQDIFIGAMFENVSFELDETGAKVENEGAIMLARGAMPDPSKRRYFYLDKPFWVIMKRAESTNPYFLLGVNNTEIMMSE